MKILIIRFSSIGDIVLTTPVVRCLKLQVPGVEIHYLTKTAFKNLLLPNPHLTKVHLLKSKLSDTIEEMRKEKFDLIVDLHNNMRTLMLKTRLGVKASSFDKLNARKWLMVNFKVNLLPDVHIVDRYLSTVEFLGVKNDGLGLDYFFDQEYNLADLLPPSHRTFIALVIGAQHATKRLPPSKLAELCRKMNSPIILLGGKDDFENGELISRESGLHVLNACGKLSLDQSAFIVKHAVKVITHDTGLMHIAAALKKEIYTVWGNTIPEFGMYPYRAEHKNFEVKGLSCRPCSKIGYAECPRGHFKCMNDQNLEEISLLTKHA